MRTCIGYKWPIIFPVYNISSSNFAVIIILTRCTSNCFFNYFQIFAIAKFVYSALSYISKVAYRHNNANASFHTFQNGNRRQTLTVGIFRPHAVCVLSSLEKEKYLEFSNTRELLCNKDISNNNFKRSYQSSMCSTHNKCSR